MKLSLCLATFNEQDFIHYPLDSAYDLADEVIIVDGGSTDNTLKIAKSYGKKVKVYNEDNPQIFHINKQKAIDKAKGEWILQLDADEKLSQELREEVSQVISEKGDLAAYQLPRKNYFLGRFLMKGGQYPDYSIRLYKNGVAHFPCKTVHESVEVKGKVGFLKNPILHYADPKFSRYLKRWQRYTQLDADLMRKEGKKPGFFSFIFMKPVAWFFSTYIRHKGFLDGWQGLVFSFFSSLRFWGIYRKYYKK